MLLTEKVLPITNNTTKVDQIPNLKLQCGPHNHSLKGIFFRHFHLHVSFWSWILHILQTHNHQNKGMVHVIRPRSAKVLTFNTSPLIQKNKHLLDK